MKTSLRILTAAACGLLLTALQSQAQINVGVDPSKTWNGWMNVSDLPSDGEAYKFGNPWGPNDLPAIFSGAELKLSPNVNAYNATDPYWVKPDGSGNKQMEANFYMESSTFGGNTVTFSGDTLQYTLAPGYYAQAFIKEFTSPTYGWVDWSFTPLVAGQPFSVSRAIAPGNIAQIGFMTVGAVANPATVSSLGYATIAVVPEPTSIAMLGLGLLALCIRRRS